MHRFLRALGFSNIKKRQDLDPVLGKIMQEPDREKRIQLRPDCLYKEMSMEFAPGTGITIRGEYDEKGFFYMEHYFPYCDSHLITSSEDVIVNKRVDSNAFTGMCDDFRLGISLIFYLQNAVDYLELHSTDNIPHKSKLTLSGLSLKGMILLGMTHTPEGTKKQTLRTNRRNRLIAKAKFGDQNAIDELTLDELDLSAKIRNCVRYEDLYSMVETSLIPYGSESDHYSILGTIVNWNHITNSYTGESLYKLVLNCNNILITVAIHEEDLLGEPMIGRRFKGIVWMQGHVDFL